MADRDKCTQAPEQSPGAAALQALFGALATTLRPWAGMLRAAAGPIYPPGHLELAEQSFEQWLAGSVDGMSCDHLAGLIVELEDLASVTPDTRYLRGAHDYGARKAKVLAEIDPDYFAVLERPERGDGG